MKTIHCLALLWNRSASVRLLAFAAAVVFSMIALPVRAQSTSAQAAYRTDRILVKPLAGVELTAVNASLGATVLGLFPAIGNLQIVQVPDGENVPALIAAYVQSGLVSYAEPDYTVGALTEPNDFFYQQGNQWGLKNTGQFGGVPGADIKAPEGWSIQSTAGDIVVAVIDTGVRYTHQDLASNMWVNPNPSSIGDVHGINAITGTGNPWDDYGHGSHVSGILGAATNNVVGIAGVAWTVQIMACKFLDATGQGSISDAITCIDYARSHNARIINASWGGYSFTSTALYDAIDSTRQAGIIFVAAVGNDANNNDVNPLYPASYNLDNIIAVAATDRTDSLASFSNYGATTVALGAPGADIWSCWNGSDSDYRYDNGTSMAAPHVVGTCALLWEHNPLLSYRQVISAILSSVDPLPTLEGKCTSGGRLDLPKALAAGSAMPNPVPLGSKIGTAPIKAPMLAALQTR